MSILIATGNSIQPGTGSDANPARRRVLFNFIARVAILVGAALGATQAASAQLTVTLNSTPGSPQPVGKTIEFIAAVLTPNVTPRYQFMIQPPGATAFNMVADYSESNTLQWSALQEGTYLVQVSVTDTTSGQTGKAQLSFQFTTHITGNVPVITATAHPLVALYSAPPCAAGTVQILYHVTGGSVISYTNQAPCQPGLSLNFYVGGMRASTSYTMQQRLMNNGTTTWGPPLTFTTGSIPSSVDLAPATIVTPFNSATSVPEDIILQSYIALAPGQGFGNTGYQPAAYNMSGQPIWYYPTSHGNLMYLTRPVAGATFLLVIWSDPTDVNVLREVDLQGNVVRETNAYTISQQLAAKGLPTINWMSHEALRLPSGHTVLLGSTERILTNEQGPGPVDVVGDMIIDLDANFQVAWTWNTFDYLPNNRVAPLGETCTNNLAPCGPLFLAQTANDWTHCNSLYLTPDQNLVLSIRNQDWIVKINYQNGTGTGQILWTLGNLANQALSPYFTTLLNGLGPWPWFSHQHDVEFDGTNYELMDNGNTRHSAPPLGLGYGNSRGQVYSLNESTLVATQVISADLGAFSGGFGSAQLLSNADYWFALGFLSNNGAPFDNAQEILPTSNTTEDYEISFPSSAYRSFRMESLYYYTN
jgi:hypothetical protein